MVADSRNQPEIRSSGSTPARAGMWPSRRIRLQSGRRLWGMPLYDVALGPDAELGEIRGHARGVFAIGDIATGVVAVGGVARGIVALGGLALGVVSFGGLSLGILMGLGGAAIAGFSFGGLAIGLFAIGGLGVGLIAQGGIAVGVVASGALSIGYYACGALAYGQHVVSGDQADPDAVAFFSRWFPDALDMIQQMRGH